MSHTTTTDAARAAGSWTDLLIGTVAALLFALALLDSTDWSFRSALFPRMVTTAGLVFSVAFVAVRLVKRLRARMRSDVVSTPAAPSGKGGGSADLVDEDDEHDHEVEYVFATAGRAAWAQALAWVAAFLAALVVGGLFVGAPVFAFVYLRWGAHRSWRFAAVYAVVLAAVLYLFLQVLLTIKTPESLFW